MHESRTRPPTGAVAYPLVLVEGEESAGKTVASLALSASSRIDHSFVLELDEADADGYASIGDFELLNHNGTYTDVLDALEWATAQPCDGRPNLIVLDTGTALWELTKDWMNSRARNSRAARKLLAEDPDAEIEVPRNLWVEAKDRWYRMLNLLRLWPGVGIVIARGKEVSKMVGGEAVAGETEWRIEAEKSTQFAVDAWVRMTRPHKATLIAVNSLHADVPARGLELPGTNPLEHLVFGVLAAGGPFHRSTAIVPTVGVASVDVKNWLVARFARAGMSSDVARSEAKSVWEASDQTGSEITNAAWLAMAEKADERIAALAS